jgi:hypothetical protein
VFTNGNVNNIEVYIDDKHQGKAQHSDGPLFVLPWQPSLLSPGVHSIRVVVQVCVHLFLAFIVSMYNRSLTTREE